jgi:hypothetical protein
MGVKTIIVPELVANLPLGLFNGPFN